MSQRFVTDGNGRRWMVGWDNPTQGFFAQRYNDAPKPDIDCYDCPYGQFVLDDPDCSTCELQRWWWEKFDVLIGFGFSIGMEKLITECARFGFELDRATIRLLHQDRRSSGPQTPLQEYIQSIFEAHGDQELWLEVEHEVMSEHDGGYDIGQSM